MINATPPLKFMRNAPKSNSVRTVMVSSLHKAIQRIESNARRLKEKKRKLRTPTRMRATLLMIIVTKGIRTQSTAVAIPSIVLAEKLISHAVFAVTCIRNLVSKITKDIAKVEATIQ